MDILNAAGSAFVGVLYLIACGIIIIAFAFFIAKAIRLGQYSARRYWNEKNGSSRNEPSGDSPKRRN